MEKPIRILHVLGTTNLGGAESRIMDLYRHMDRDRVQFDFLIHTQKEGFFDQEIEQLGGHIYRLPRFRLYNYLTYRKAVKSFFQKHHSFRMVQGHMTSAASIYLPIAKKAGVATTIAHARSAGVDQGLKGSITKWLRRNLAQKCDYCFTCSALAGEAVFGKKAMEAGRVTFLPNAIDCPSFTYDVEKKKEMQALLGLENCYIIGHVGRFHYAKNHEYLLRIFAKLVEMEGENPRITKEAFFANGLRLILLGEGSGMDTMKELAKELQIEELVLFLGNHKNVQDYYQVMDFFVYPSRYEGLPGTMVEAQSSGLRCIMSDRICEEVQVTDLVETRSIDQAPEEWAAYILQQYRYSRKSPIEQMQAAGFDVAAQAEKMMEFYERESKI